jgi:hypothetical protein
MTLKITLTTATLALGLGFGAAAQSETVLTVSSWVPQIRFEIAVEASPVHLNRWHSPARCRR